MNSRPDPPDADISGLLDVEDDLELEQRCAGRDGLLRLTRVGSTCVAVAPRGEVLLGLPLSHHEVPVLARGGAEQLEAQEAGGVVDGVRPIGESLLQLGAGASGTSIALIFTTAMRESLLR